MYSEDLARIEELVRVKYSASDIIEVLKDKRQNAHENQMYERGREDVLDQVINLLNEYIADWSKE